MASNDMVDRASYLGLEVEIDRLRARVAELEGERQRGRTYAVSLLGSACEAARSRLKALLGDPKQDHYTRATMSQIDRALEVAAGLDTPATKGGADGE